MTGLLKDTAEYWKAKDVQIRDWYSDSQGRYAFLIRVADKDRGIIPFVVTARTGMRTPLGVMQRVVSHALDASPGDGHLLIRIGSKDTRGGPDHYVFDPKTAVRHGEVRTADHDRQRRGEEWVDMHPQWGVSFVDFWEGRQTPTRPDEPVTPVSAPAQPEADDRNADLSDYAGQ